MLSSLKLLNEALVLLIALLAGLFVFGRMGRFHLIMFWQLVVWMLFLTASYLLIAWQRYNGYDLNSHMVHNIYLPVEGAFLCAAASVQLGRARFGRAGLWGFGIILIFYAWCLMTAGFNKYAFYADVAACFVYSFLFAMIMFQGFRENRSWWRNSEIYISAGVLIYAACSVPYFTAFDFLQINYPSLSKTLFHLVNDVLANVRYLLLAIGFWLVKIN